MAADPKSKRFIERFGLWFSRHYMLVVNSLLAIFVLGTMAAPVFMQVGWIKAGKSLYIFYSQFCHQFAFRSWFLFGSQPYYPSMTSGDLVTYQEMFHVSAGDLQAAREIIGNELAGYKIAICQRDIAIYTSLMLAGLVFSVLKGNLERIPLWIWFVAGVIPLGLDGLTQLTSSGLQIPGLSLIRESTPLLRTITGALFGFLSGWYIYPTLKQSLLRENEKIKRGTLGDR